MSINQFGKRLQNHRVGVLLCLVLFASGALRAEQLPIKTYTTADGLPRDQINRIVRDSHGFLWFCTPEGLSRFDGYTFTNYTTDQGLPHRNVNDLLETRSGIYWVATSNGLSRFNPLGSAQPNNKAQGNPKSSEAMIVTYRANEERARGVNVLFEDQAGTIWCGTNGGLYKLEQTGQRWSFRFVDLGMPAEAWDDATVNVITEDKRGALWVGAGSGLYRYLPVGRSERFTVQDGLPQNPVSALLIDRDGRLWVGGKSGLCQFVLEKGPSRPKASRVYTTSDGLANNDIKSLFQSSDGRLWIGIFGGLSELVSKGRDAEPKFRSYTTAQGLSAFGIFAVAEDRDGNIWLGTESAGAMKMARSGFVTFSKADGLGSDRIAAIFEDQAGELCTVSSATDKWFINRFDGQRFAAVVPNLSKAITEFGWGWKQIHFQDREGEWWVPTAHGLYRFPKTNQLDQLAHVQPKAVYTKKDGLPTADVFRLFEDAQGDLWIVTSSAARNGLTRWERATGILHNYDEADGISHLGLITGFCEDKAGNLWLSSADGLIRFAAGRFTMFTTSSGLPAGWIFALYLDHASRLWVASGEGGVARIDDPGANQPRFVTYTTTEGLSSNSAGCLTEDGSGRIYIGTGRGLDRLDPATGHISHYSSADGLARGRISEAFRDRHGVLWFGTAQGLSRLVPEPDRPSAPPPILITALRVAGVAYPISELGETKLPELELGTNQKDIQINFVGLSFRSGEVLRYQYKLEGVDRYWSALSDERTITFANLSPGNYRFLVQAVTADGVKSSSPATIVLTILPPLWQRWWFLALVALTASLAIYSLYRYRVARLLELERVRTRIATDLHDDIGSSLSQVSVLSEVIRRRIGDKPAVAEPLSMIANLSRDLIDSMNDIVWAINPKRDRLSDLTQRMRRFASDAFTVRDIEFSFSAPDPEYDTRLGADMRREIFLIFKESINNVVRHSGCNEARIDFSIQHGALELRVYDDGRGFYPEIASDGNGLASMRQRALRIGGALDISSQGEQGTTVSLKAPLDDHHWIWRGRKPHG
jgi:ligand-binding sensor domain-containing protein